MKKVCLVSWMMCALLLALMASGGCSVLDGDDRDDLETAIEQAPREDRDTMAAMVVSAKTRRYLEGRAPNEKVISVACQVVTPAGPGPWAEQDRLWASVMHVRTCIGLGEKSYQQCLKFLSNIMTNKFVDDWNAAKNLMAADDPRRAWDLKCMGIIEPGFEPIEVPGGQDDLSRVTTSDIVDWVLGQPSPPRGFTPSLIRALAPFVCALSGAGGWCGATSGPPGGDAPIVISSGATGDYP